jgi:hypothetical protein
MRLLDVTMQGRNSNMRKLCLIVSFVAMFSAVAFAQRPVGDDDSQKARVTAPASFEAKYEGGMFGYNQKETGSLKFDDTNTRIVFFGKDEKEKFSVPYNAMLVVYPNSESVTSTTGNVIKYIPLPGAGLASLLKEKRRYLVIQFDDPDVDVRGTISFRVEDKETLDVVVPALGDKAKLTQRGDAYYRPRPAKPTI